MYNISSKKWIRHLKFEEGDILKMVKVAAIKGK